MKTEINTPISSIMSLAFMLAGLWDWDCSFSWHFIYRKFLHCATPLLLLHWYSYFRFFCKKYYETILFWDKWKGESYNNCYHPACSFKTAVLLKHLNLFAQTSLLRIDQMPELPQPLKIIDWKKKALQFDSLVYNFKNQASYGPLIWIDSSRRKLRQYTYGLYTVIGDVRQGQKKTMASFMKRSPLWVHC